MVDNKNDGRTCNFTIPVDALDGKTGVSAYDKYLTIKHLINGNKNKLKIPGHTFPLITEKNGVLKRQGHTEASLELIKLAKINPEAAVICELMNRKKGRPMIKKELEEFSHRYKISIVDIKDIINYRTENAI